MALLRRAGHRFRSAPEAVLVSAASIPGGQADGLMSGCQCTVDRGPHSRSPKDLAALTRGPEVLVVAAGQRAEWVTVLSTSEAGAAGSGCRPSTPGSRTQRPAGGPRRLLQVDVALRRWSRSPRRFHASCPGVVSPMDGDDVGAAHTVDQLVESAAQLGAAGS